MPLNTYQGGKHMKFSEYPYHTIDVNEAKQKLQDLKERLVNAKDYEAFKKAFQDLDTYKKEIYTQFALCEVRHTIDTRDAYYKKEQDHIDEIAPILQEDLVQIADVVLNSPFRKELEKEVPSTYFLAKEFDKKCFSPNIIEELQAENKYASQYQQLVASAQIEWEDKKCTLSELEPFMKSKDRNVRKKATKAYWGWFAQHENELGEIFDQLVQVRTRMAQKLGYENYIQLGYYRMYRFDYTQEEVKKYRQQILDTVVPVATNLYDRQQKRLGLNALYAWDEKFEFQNGNPTPKYDAKTMVEIALHMYQQLDKDTGEFFKYMVDHELMDLKSKPGKAAGGYCTSFDMYGAPFIFANFNQTSQDVETLTHEAGHAYQAYSSRNIFPSDCMWPTSESAEIHSMSMEFLTYPWMKDFFKEDIDKFYFNHLSDAIKFLPYGVLVDHFQHEVYAHPDYTHQQRMDTWRKLEKMYLPHKNYEEIDVLQRGGWWMRQLHIFMDPFYYIDYTLAQVCALQFWNRSQKKDPNTLKDYKKICRLGGSLPFKEIVKAANLKSPFEDGCLDETMKAAQSALDALSKKNLQ